MPGTSAALYHGIHTHLLQGAAAECHVHLSRNLVLFKGLNGRVGLGHELQEAMCDEPPHHCSALVLQQYLSPGCGGLVRMLEMV